MCHLPESICTPPLPADGNASSCPHHSSFSIHLDRSRLCWPSTNTSRLHATTCIVESLCIVVCMSTKAVHLELCADLTTPEFMAALHRFCNRRGTPADIYSDNGTNFQGANHKLDEVRQLMTSKSTSTAISHFTTKPHQSNGTLRHHGPHTLAVCGRQESKV